MTPGVRGASGVKHWPVDQHADAGFKENVILLLHTYQ